MSLRRFDEIEHMLADMCNKSAECRHRLANKLVMKNAVESEPVKPNVGNMIPTDLKHTEGKR